MHFSAEEFLRESVLRHAICCHAATKDIKELLEVHVLAVAHERSHIHCQTPNLRTDSGRTCTTDGTWQRTTSRTHARMRAHTHTHTHTHTPRAHTGTNTYIHTCDSVSHSRSYTFGFHKRWQHNRGIWKKDSPLFPSPVPCGKRPAEMLSRLRWGWSWRFRQEQGT